MENASKALIIAGAVLLAILLVSVGMMVLNSVSDPLNQSKNSNEAQGVQIFNESFMQFLGEEITGQQAKSLISAVNASNGKNADHQVTLEGITKVSGISTKNHYSAIEDLDGSGYINKITITKK